MTTSDTDFKIGADDLNPFQRQAVLKRATQGCFLKMRLAMRGIHIAFRAHRGTQHEGVLEVLVLVDEDEMVGAAQLATHF